MYLGLSRKSIADRDPQLGRYWYILSPADRVAARVDCMWCTFHRVRDQREGHKAGQNRRALASNYQFKYWEVYIIAFRGGQGLLNISVAENNLYQL